jgi:hypothetical protein
MAESLIERGEVEGLLFNVADMVVTLHSIERLLTESGDDEEEADED